MYKGEGSATITYCEVDDGCLACRSDELISVEAASLMLFGQEPLFELEVSIWLPVKSLPVRSYPIGKRNINANEHHCRDYGKDGTTSSLWMSSRPSSSRLRLKVCLS